MASTKLRIGSCAESGWQPINGEKSAMSGSRTSRLIGDGYVGGYYLPLPQKRSRSAMPIEEVKEKLKRAIVAAVQLPNVTEIEFEASLTELRELAKTLGFEIVRTFIQKRPGFDRTGYLGVGKRQEIHGFVNNQFASADAQAGDSDAAGLGNEVGSNIDILFIDHEISPFQARTLEVEVGCEVMDRTMVILEIFHRNARSRAAKAQVEIARLGYMAPHLREAAKLAGPQGRQRSGTGGRGAGESHTELDRRKIRDRIAELQKELVAMDLERKTQRARRQENEGLASVALVGYTNAGKSTLMRALTGSEVLVANKLFATLDTTVRTLYPESVPRVLVSDTVGFIKNLPHGLVASFKSTLEEALDASLLLHVIDASDPGFERQLEVTDKVLKEIGAHVVPRIRVFNKIDHVGDTAAQVEREAALRAQYPDCMVMSARRPEDIAKLHKMIVASFQQQFVETELFLSWSAQQLRKEIYVNCEVLEERADGEGAFFRVRGAPDAVEKLRVQFDLAR
ncbi:MAG: putative GTP-binding protein [Rhodocyclales bacterium]|nr:putative GTP-binding protein [Rhodocyclales bacterium]